MWHSNRKYSCTVWRYNKKFRKAEFCSTPHLKEEAVKRAFTAFKSIIQNKAEILSGYEELIDKITNSKTEEVEKEKIDKESAEIESGIEKLIAENARSAIEQSEYNRRYEASAARYNALKKTAS